MTGRHEGRELSSFYSCLESLILGKKIAFISQHPEEQKKRFKKYVESKDKSLLYVMERAVFGKSLNEAT